MIWSIPRGGNYMPTPVVLDGLAYFCNDRGVLTVLDAVNGEVFYKQRLGSGKSGFTGSAVAADGKLYIPSEDGDVYVVRLGREFDLLATNELGETFLSSPAISEGVLFFRARSHLMAVGELSAAD